MDSNNLPNDINLVFNGSDGKEAESFISSVLRTARTEGKLRDNEWIVDLVSTCMRGQALRWYIELDEDTQNDWKLLRKAILRQYTSPAQPSAPSLQPTIPIPAAAATPPNPVVSNQPAQAPETVYRIRVYLSNTKSKFFLCTNGSHPGVYLTSSDAKAFRVSWAPGNELRLIENGLETFRIIWLLWFAPSFNSQSPRRADDFAALLISDSVRNVPHIAGFFGATQRVNWTLDKDGWLQSYSFLDETKYQLQFNTEPKGGEGCVVSVCLPPALDGLNIHANMILTMKLEPV